MVVERFQNVQNRTLKNCEMGTRRLGRMCFSKQFEHGRVPVNQLQDYGWERNSVYNTLPNRYVQWSLIWEMINMDIM